MSIAPNATACSTWRLYVIIDRQACGNRSLLDVASAAIRGGADVIQLRDKISSSSSILQTASNLLKLTHDSGVPLIINDRADIAYSIGASGVHLGQDDLPVKKAREILGRGCLIGKSTHSLGQALLAEKEGADYIGLGPIFSTPTKPEYQSVGMSLIAQVASQVDVPIVCIGGLDAKTLPQVLRAGTICVAVVRAVCAADDPRSAARELKDLIVQFDLRRDS